MNITNPGVTFTHQGDSNFSVLAWNEDGRDLLVNEIGEYDGTVRSPTGIVFYGVLAFRFCPGPALTVSGLSGQPRGREGSL